MECKPGKLDGVKLITPDLFEDYRGRYVEIYDSKKYKEFLGDTEFVQDDISVSKKNVLRGIHGDFNTSKLVSVLHGEVYALIADNRPKSKTYKQWEAHILSASNRMQIFIPAGIGNSIVSLQDDTVYHYKQTSHFVPNSQFTIQWNDESWNFWWPINNPILSQRDYFGKYVTEGE